ncbi:hypothetical protein [Haloarcula sebkhae]|uniref:Uncharacterized protein n=2 Tax=Haloarcula sebkhae TaxID=932660 RepID=A0ACC6VR40_9EURY|nr:hypothetical protein [Haloarcula sebkhae]GGK84818.1 hypothetical protein GCM10009067_41190 [Haloarcula sebkhae]
MRLIGDRRILLGSVCVETVATAIVLLYGHLSLIAVAVLYWIDLLFLTFRTTAQQLLSRPVTEDRSTTLQRPFRLLAHKRGSITVTDRLPGVYLRNFAGVPGAVFVLALSATTTAYVAAVYVPSEMWVSPAALLLFGGGLIAAATKSWLVLKAYVASGGHEVNPASAVTPRKRMLAFAVYGGLLWLASKWTLTTLSQEGPEIARAGMTVSASVLIVSRFAYGWYASRAQPDNGRTGAMSESNDEAASHGQSEPTAKRDAPLPSSPSVPDGEPRETMAPVRASILAAGVVNAMTTGGVVDNRFGHWRQLTIRVGLAAIMAIAVLALLDGAVVVSATLAAISLSLVGALLVVSAAHMLLALGGVEYRFHKSRVVAYDRYLGRLQWSASYDRVRNVSVGRGLFGSPLWLDAGTVFFDRIPNPEGGESTREPRSSIAFVSDPERAGELLQSRDEQ